MSGRKYVITANFTAWGAIVSINRFSRSFVYFSVFSGFFSGFYCSPLLTIFFNVLLGVMGFTGVFCNGYLTHRKL